MNSQKKREGSATFIKGELVYAKIRGYPWWPAVVGEVNVRAIENGEKKYEWLVNFIGDNSHSVVTEDKLHKFSKKEVNLKDKKNKKLMDSIAIANDIFDSKIDYIEWRQKDDEKYRRKQKRQQKIDKYAKSESRLSENIEITTISETSEDGDEIEVYSNAPESSSRSSSSDEEYGEFRLQPTNFMKALQNENSMIQQKKPMKKLISMKEQATAAVSPKYQDDDLYILKRKSLKLVVDDSDDDNDEEKNNKQVSSFRSEQEYIEINDEPHIKIPKSQTRIIIETDDDEEEEIGGISTISYQQEDLLTKQQPSSQLQTRPIILLHPPQSLPEASQKLTASFSTYSANSPIRQSFLSSNVCDGWGGRKTLNKKKFDEDEISDYGETFTSQGTFIDKKLSESKKKQKIEKPVKEKLGKKIKKPVKERVVSNVVQEEQSSSTTTEPRVLNLDNEFDEFFSQVQSITNSDDIEQCLSTLGVILQRILDAQPTQDNIVDILGQDVGKLLVCIQKLYFTEGLTSPFSSITMVVPNLKFINLKTQLNELIDQLNCYLQARFFDAEEKIRIIRSLSGSQFEDTRRPKKRKITINQQTKEDFTPKTKRKKRATNEKKDIPKIIVNPLDFQEQQTQTPSNRGEDTISLVSMQENKGELDPTAIFQQTLTDEKRVMKEKIILKIAKKLKRFSTQEKGKEQAKDIESIFRQKDPNMNEQYKSLIKKFITFISTDAFHTTTQRIEEYIRAGSPSDFQILSRKDSICLNVIEVEDDDNLSLAKNCSDQNSIQDIEDEDDSKKLQLVQPHFNISPQQKIILPLVALKSTNIASPLREDEEEGSRTNASSFEHQPFLSESTALAVNQTIATNLAKQTSSSQPTLHLDINLKGQRQFSVASAETTILTCQQMQQL